MLNIIIDTDPGVDDAQAIAFAIAHPDINLRGLTTVFGNATVEITTRNALQLVEHLCETDIPVARGAEQPLKQARFPSPDFVHGTDAMGNIDLPLPSSQPHSLDAADFIIQQANEFGGELCLVAIGPLTNLAIALDRDPGLAEKIDRVVVMGGTVTEPGNVSPVAEANFIGDPHAADAVVSAGWDLTIVGLDVTHQTLLYDRDLANIRDHCGTSGKLLWDSSRFYFDFYSSTRDLTDDSEHYAPMHDASALVQLVQPELFETVKGAACVASEGPALGQLMLDRKGYDYFLPYWRDRPSIKVAMQVNAQRAHDLFVETLINGMPS